MAMAIADIEAMIRAALPDAKVEVRDLAGAGADDSGGVNEGADLRTRSAASAAAFCRDKACAGHETS